jgi:hypothetical protein
VATAAGVAAVGGELDAADAEAEEGWPAGGVVAHPAAALIRINAKSAPTTLSAHPNDLGTK